MSTSSESPLNAIDTLTAMPQNLMLKYYNTKPTTSATGTTPVDGPVVDKGMRRSRKGNSESSSFDTTEAYEHVEFQTTSNVYRIPPRSGHPRSGAAGGPPPPESRPNQSRLNLGWGFLAPIPKRKCRNSLLKCKCTLLLTFLERPHKYFRDRINLTKCAHLGVF